MYTPPRAALQARQGPSSRSDKKAINNGNVEINYNDNWAPWRGGQMTPPQGNWFDWLIPTTIKRRRQDNNIRNEAAVGLSPRKENKKESNEERKGEDDDEEAEGEIEEPAPPNIHGNVDSGHCAASLNWAENGTCMCSITWAIPGWWPRSFCMTVRGGIVQRTVKEEALADKTGEEEEEAEPVEPCWLVQPVPEEPEKRMCWERLYNKRTGRHEYIYKQWRPPPTEEPEEISPEKEPYIPYIKMSPEPPLQPNPPLSPYGPDEPEPEEPFTCSRKPPWLRHVHKFVRAEELDSPPAPASEFVSKTGTLLGKFSEGYFKVPYYDVPYRSFRYADPSTIDMKNLKFNFKSKAPAPVPAPIRRPKLLPKRPLVMPRRKEPITIRRPQDDYRPTPPRPPLVRVPEISRPRPQPRPPAPNIFHRPRSVMFPPSYGNTPEDDTPCPPPRKFQGKIPAPKKKKVAFNEDNEYRLIESEEAGESEDEEMIGGVSKKKKKKRRRRRDSDPTYKQHGVRENNRVERRDLQQMYNEEVRENGETRKEQITHQPKHKIASKPKSILKTGRQEAIDELARGKGFLERILSSPWLGYKQAVRENTPHPRKGTLKRNSSEDGNYIPSQTREEEERERIDVRDMVDHIDRQTDEDFGVSEDEFSKPIKTVAVSDFINPSRPPITPARKRKPVEDRAYRPGRGLGF